MKDQKIIDFLNGFKTPKEEPKETQDEWMRRKYPALAKPKDYEK